MSNVEFNQENFGHCRCPICPVQKGNDCAKEKLELFDDFETAEKDPRGVAKVYCSIGISNCQGLKSARPCLCPTCAVWYENRLGKLHFCTKGSARERSK